MMTEDIWAKNGGVHFGFGSDSTEGEPPPLTAPLRYVGDRHLLTVGPNGSGKSRRALVRNLASLTDWSMLSVDPKGDHAIMTGEHRRAAGNEVFYLNPFNVHGLKSSGFNPVAALDPRGDDFPDDALGLAEAIIRVEGKDPHFGQAAQELVTALIMYVRLMADVPASGLKGSLSEVRTLLGLDPDAFRENVRAMLEAAEVFDCEELSVKAGRFAGLSPENNEMNSVVSTALAQTRWLDSRPVKADLSTGSLNFALMKERPVTVYLILPPRRLATHSTWLRLMITAALQALMKDTRAARVPVMLMLDEYFAIAKGGFSIVEDNMAMFRGYGIKLWTVLQDLAQAHKLYGEYWESFAANAGVLQAFAPQDLVTAEYLSRRTGQVGRDVLNWGQASTPGSHKADGNVTLSKIAQPLMLPQDLRNMDMGFFVLFSHKAKGTIRGYAPDPTEVTELKAIMARDPSRLLPA